jgi:hypothetical protein
MRWWRGEGRTILSAGGTGEGGGVARNQWHRPLACLTDEPCRQVVGTTLTPSAAGVRSPADFFHRKVVSSLKNVTSGQYQERFGRYPEAFSQYEETSSRYQETFARYQEAFA